MPIQRNPYMNLFMSYKGVIPKKTCNKIIKLGKQKKVIKATIDSNKYRPDLRVTNVSFLNPLWMYNLFAPYIRDANQQLGWNYVYDWCEDYQFAEYKKSGHYNWHRDIHDDPYQGMNTNFNGKVRKLSLICSLNEDYEGGELEVWNPDPRKTESKRIMNVKDIKTMGTVVIFSSLLWHRIKPVTKKTRYSIVNWVLGFPWR